MTGVTWTGYPDRRAAEGSAKTIRVFPDAEVLVKQMSDDGPAGRLVGRLAAVDQGGCDPVHDPADDHQTEQAAEAELQQGTAPAPGQPQGRGGHHRGEDE